MKIPAHSLIEIEKLKPCKKRLEVVRGMGLGLGKITAKEAVEAGVSFDDLVWVASAVAIKDIDVKFRLTGWMADGAAHVLNIFEKEYPDDIRPRQAIEATHQFLRGKITEAAWAARAADAAWAANAAWAARAAGAADAAWAAEAAWAEWATGAAEAAWATGAAEAAWAAGASEAARAAGAAERQWQLDRLVYWLSEENPKFWPLPKPAQATKAAYLVKVRATREKPNPHGLRLASMGAKP